MRDVWFQAIMAQAPRICGRRLLPYSLAHDYILRSLGSPVRTGETPTRAQLFTALLVCSRTLAQNRRTLHTQPLDLLRLALWSWRWRKMRIETAVSSFRQYMEDFSAAPERWTKEGAGAGKEIAAPLAYHVVRVLCSVYGCTMAEAWDMPNGLALCYFDAHREAEGDDTLVTQRQAAIIECTNEAAAAAAAGDAEGAKAWGELGQRIANAGRS